MQKTSISEMVNDFINAGSYYEALALIKTNAQSLERCDVLESKAICYLQLGLDANLGKSESRPLLRKGLSFADQALVQCPQMDIDTRMLLLGRKGVALHHIGDRAESINILKQALSLDDGFIGFGRYALEFLTQFLIEDGDFEDASAHLNRAINDDLAATDNERALLYAWLAKVDINAERANQAAEFLRLANLKLNRDYDDYGATKYKVLDIEYEYLLRCVPHSDEQQIAVLTQQLDIATDPHVRADCLVALGAIQQKTERFSDALTSFQNAINEHPQSSVENQAHLYYAALAYRLKQNHEAERHFKYPLPSDMKPQVRAEYMLIKANNYLALGKRRMAITCYLQILALILFKPGKR